MPPTRAWFRAAPASASATAAAAVVAAVLVLLPHAAAAAAAVAEPPARSIATDAGPAAAAPTAVAVPQQPTVAPGEPASTSPPAAASAAEPPPAGPPAVPPDLNKRELRRTAPGQPAAGGTAAASPAAPATLDASRVLLALTVVVGLILFLRWAGRKYLALPAAGTSALMQVVARTALAPRQQLMLVRVGRRLMVIGDSGGRLSGLGQIEDPDEVAALLGQVRSSSAAAAAGGLGTASFGTLFGRLGQNFKNRNGHGGGADDDSDLDEATDSARRFERQQLLGGPGGSVGDDDGGLGEQGSSDGTDAADSRRPYGLAGADGDPRTADGPADVGLDEAEAQAAVEGARHDIQALRARLREVTERLTDTPPAGGAIEPSRDR